MAIESWEEVKAQFPNIPEDKLRALYEEYRNAMLSQNVELPFGGGSVASTVASALKSYPKLPFSEKGYKPAKTAEQVFALPVAIAKGGWEALKRIGVMPSTAVKGYLKGARESKGFLEGVYKPPAETLKSLWRLSLSGEEVPSEKAFGKSRFAKTVAPSVELGIDLLSPFLLSKLGKGVEAIRTAKELGTTYEVGKLATRTRELSRGPLWEATAKELLKEPAKEPEYLLGKLGGEGGFADKKSAERLIRDKGIRGADVVERNGKYYVRMNPRTLSGKLVGRKGMIPFLKPEELEKSKEVKELVKAGKPFAVVPAEGVRLDQIQELDYLLRQNIGSKIAEKLPVEIEDVEKARFDREYSSPIVYGFHRRYPEGRSLIWIRKELPGGTKQVVRSHEIGHLIDHTIGDDWKNLGSKIIKRLGLSKVKEPGSFTFSDVYLEEIVPENEWRKLPEMGGRWPRKPYVFNRLREHEIFADLVNMYVDAPDILSKAMPKTAENIKTIIEEVAKHVGAKTDFLRIPPPDYAHEIGRLFKGGFYVKQLNSLARDERKLRISERLVGGSEGLLSQWSKYMKEMEESELGILGTTADAYHYLARPSLRAMDRFIGREMSSEEVAKLISEGRYGKLGKSGAWFRINFSDPVQGAVKSELGNHFMEYVRTSDTMFQRFRKTGYTKLQEIFKGIKEYSDADNLLIEAVQDPEVYAKLPKDLQTRAKKLKEFFEWGYNEFVRFHVSNPEERKFLEYVAEQYRRGRITPENLTALKKNLSENGRIAIDFMTGKLENYATHLFDKDLIKNEMLNELKAMDEEINAGVADSKLLSERKKLQEALVQLNKTGEIRYDQLPSRMKAFFEYRRTGAEGYVKSASKASRTYLETMARRTFDQAVVRKYSEIKGHLPQSEQMYLDEFLRRYVGKDRSLLDELAQTINWLEYTRVLGGNVRTAFFTNPMQELNIFNEYGLMHSIAAYRYAFNPEVRMAFDATYGNLNLALKFMPKMNEVSGSRLYNIIMNVPGYLLNLTERGMHLHAFAAEYLRATMEGVTGAERLLRANDAVAKLVFRYGRAGMPLVLTKPGGAVALQFWSYPIKQLSLMMNWSPAKLARYIGLAVGVDRIADAMNIDISNAVGMPFCVRDMIQALKSMIMSRTKAAKFQLLAALRNGGGGLFPYGFGPAVELASSVWSAWSEEVGGQSKLISALVPLQIYRLNVARRAIEEGKDKQGYYRIKSLDGKVTLSKTKDFKDIVMFAVGPMPRRITLQRQEATRQRMTAKFVDSVLNEFVQKLLDKDIDGARALTQRYPEAFTSVDLRDRLESQIKRQLLTTEERLKLKQIRRSPARRALFPGKP